MQDFVERARRARAQVWCACPGTAVFLNANSQTTPLAMRANVEHNHVLHERVMIVSIETERVPHVYHEDRLTYDELGNAADGISGLSARFGFQDPPNVPAMLRLAADSEMLERSIDLDASPTSSRRSRSCATDAPGMRPWRKRLFLALAHNAANPVVLLPPARRSHGARSASALRCERRGSCNGRIRRSRLNSPS